MIVRLAVTLLAFVIVIGTGPRGASAAEALSQSAMQDKTVPVIIGEPAMEAAFDRARSTLPAFAETLARPAASMKSFAVKVGLPTPRGSEFVWLSSPLLQDGKVRGFINNRLEYAKNYLVGQWVEFPDTAIVDWMYMDAGKMKGNFTMCAIASKLSKQEHDDFASQFNIDCPILK